MREKEPSKECAIPALSSLAIQNSHGFYVKEFEHNLIESPCLSVTSNGVNAGTVFVQVEPFAIVRDAYALVVKDRVINQSSYIFLSTVLQKLLIDKYGFNEKAIWNKVKKERIPLPANYNEEKDEYEPDWKYMENYIEERKRVIEGKLRSLEYE